jgi:hypothetical protein
MCGADNRAAGEVLSTRRRLEKPADAKRAILTACGLDEVSLALGVCLKGNVVILRVIKPVFYENAVSSHCYLRKQTCIKAFPVAALAERRDHCKAKPLCRGCAFSPRESERRR